MSHATASDTAERVDLGAHTPSSTWPAAYELVDYSDDLARALVRIDALRALDEDWDSYGSPPPSESLVDLVEALVISIDQGFSPFLPAPHVVAVPGGGVQLDWVRGVRQLGLEMGPSVGGETEVEFLRVSHGEPINEGRVGAISELLEHIAWVIQG